jgi:hypothetical protein
MLRTSVATVGWNDRDRHRRPDEAAECRLSALA